MKLQNEIRLTLGAPLDKEEKYCTSFCITFVTLGAVAARPALIFGHMISSDLFLGLKKLY